MSPSTVPEASSRSIRFVFFYDSGFQPIDCDVARVLSILKKLQGLGTDVQIVDVTGLNDDERSRAR